MKPTGPVPAYSMEWIKKKRKMPSWVEGTFVALLILFVVLFVLWSLLTLMLWTLPFDGNPTLVEVIKGQWEWAKKLKIY